MSNLIKKFIKFFKLTASSELELYVISKRPQNTAEAEYWIKYYNQSNCNKLV